MFSQLERVETILWLARDNPAFPNVDSNVNSVSLSTASKRRCAMVVQACRAAKPNVLTASSRQTGTDVVIMHQFVKADVSPGER
jgi:hypothetical protein